MKTAFPYYGGKTRVAESIVELLPDHDHYVEPFFGAGSVLLAKAPAMCETANDLNGEIVTFFRVLREQPDELERVCALTPHSRAEHAASRHRPEDLTDLERARRIFVNLSQGRNASLRKTGWVRGQTGGTGSRPRYLQTMVGRFQPIAERLLNVSWECRDGIELVRDYGKHASNLLYLDPPYLALTRTSRGYALEMDGVEAHRNLLDECVAASAAVVISGYASPLYSEVLKGWNAIQITGARDTLGRDRDEVVWMNRDVPSYLFHDGDLDDEEVL